MKRVVAGLLLLAACGGKAAPEAAKAKTQERAASGWMWTRTDLVLRTRPASSAATSATIPAKSRVSYTKVMEHGGNTTWYWVSSAGWAPAAQLSVDRITAAPAPSPAPRVSANATGVKPILDARALTNVDGTPAQSGDAATDLATLQVFVDNMFGGKPEKIKAGRVADAKAFKQGIP